MKFKTFIYLLFLLLSFSGISQTFSGIVLDAKTKIPIESAAIYFDNTTIGTTTDSEGKFSILYTDANQSGLVISYLGYQTETILDYRQKNNITVYLKQTNNVLDEVIVYADDGLTRRQKLRLFRKQFLGFSSFAKSCKILNEKDLILRYNRKKRQLTASAFSPIIIENKSLQYVVFFDIKQFEINFNYVEEINNVFEIKSVNFSGKSFYKNFDNFKENKAKRNREKAYKGSVLEFMRALYNEALEAKGYQIFSKRFKVNPWDYFKIQQISNTSSKRVLLDKPVNILYDKNYQTKIEFLEPAILIDEYGNYSDVTKVMFSGYLGNQRVGDLLPLDYGLQD
ncbi:carboxypeptidase-like regulatory domain-containing protein [Jejuia spongiicola]|uniref:Carboxypeptidase-like regulatory domain-containing protein n=1 Tax=Jejuia spongiicola TaxID=2942207 RepID=A0ABT0QII1_9FLAO|nr:MULTISPECIES: carboxypeptidase-like regulatory domain-containing protein [Flavobacteriaceae]MCL6296288.1 carboxypeptidase-like regulatory domain-containing protein [Jejuia spongiicola]PIA79140.1 hypothetical protein BFR04_06365 [Gaetbulibacter sp. 4G1]